MSVDVLEERVHEFLGSVVPEVISVTGRWGVGKTFAWNRWLERIRHEEDGIALPRYSYVSLFGLNSLAELKFSIFQNAMKSEMAGLSPSLATLKDHMKGLSESAGRRFMPVLFGLPYLGAFQRVIESVSFFSVRETIVCLDDFERRGSSLSLKDVMGLVSLLREQQGCKVVLILNSDAIEEAERDDFAGLREKVVDVEYQFSPTPGEAVAIALPGDDSIDQQLATHCIHLKISNIRIINRIRRFAREIAEELAEFDAQVLEQALQSLVLFSWCQLSAEGDAPKYDYVRNRGRGVDVDFLDQSKPPENRKWDALLQGYGHHVAHDFDLAVAEVVERGFVNRKELKAAAQRLWDELHEIGSRTEFHDMWKPFFNSFGDNEELVVSGLRESLLKNMMNLRGADLNGAVCLMRDLGRDDDEADSLIESYVRARAGDADAFDLGSSRHFGDRIDERLEEAFAQSLRSIPEDRQLVNILADAGANGDIAREDSKVVLAASADDFLRVLSRQ